MILNSYAVLAVFFALLRLVLGVLVVACGAFGWRRWHDAPPEGRTAQENAGHLAFLLALTLVLLGLASWPLLYLLLQSYVPEWPGAMCIYGVTRVGQGSFGPARHLPGLLAAMQVIKPLLVFAGGAWYVLHLLNRHTRSAPLTGRVFAALVPLGLLAMADAAADLTYVAIPKKEEFASAGCCTVSPGSSAARFLPAALVGEAGRPWLYAAYFGITLILIAALAWWALRPEAVPSPLALGAMLAVGVAALATFGLFLVDVLAPALLRLPYHHCAYDLVPDAPEGVVAVILFLGGTFALGWAASAAWLGRAPQTRPLVPGTVRGLLRVSLWCHATSLALVSAGMVLS